MLFREVTSARRNPVNCHHWVIAFLLFFGRSLFGETAPDPVRVTREAMGLLSAQCLSCHNSEKHKGGLDLGSRDGLLKGAESGPALVEGKPEESTIYRVLMAEADPHMPPKKQLSTNQIRIVREWIAAGAPYDSQLLARAAIPREVKWTGLPASYRPVLALAVSPEGKRLAVGRREGIFIHDLAATNFPVITNFIAHVEAVRSLAWSADGKQLASGSFRELKVWDAEKWGLAWAQNSNLLGQVTSVRFTPHGGAVVVADSEIARAGWVRVLASGDGRELSSWEAHGDEIFDMTLSPDGGLVGTASADKLVRLWELVSRKETGEIEAHAGAVLGLSFNTNASEIVTIGADKQLKVWDAKSKLSTVTIGGRQHGFDAVVWSANGKMVVAADDDGRLLRFTDFKGHTGEQSSATATERELGKWAEPIQSIAVNAEGTRIFAGSQDGLVYITDAEGKLEGKLEPENLPDLAKPADAKPVPSFVRDVLPVMAKAGCMAGSCHAKAEGQNGFKLSVFSYDPKSDFNEIVKEARGRRVFPAAPAESLLLLKPTMALEHGGGQRIEPGSETYELLSRWIGGGMVYQHPNEPTLARISVEPREGTYQMGATQKLKVEAHYTDGSRREVTALADYVSNEKEIARVDENGLVTIGKLDGEGVVVARFMGFVDASRITVPADRVLPPEKFASLPANNFIDRLAYSHFRKLGIFPSDLCSDAEFIRRSTLDAIGILPSPEETKAFLADTDPGKRKRWIEYLLQHPSYADYWANKWADLLRPNPDRVGVKSIFTLDQWLRESFRTGKTHDQFVREILLAEGSNHQDGPVVVYRDRRDPPELTTMFSQLFLGVRMECAKCHHHPNEKWSQDDFYQFAAYFGPLKQKGHGLSPPISAGAETFYFAPGGSVRHPVSGDVMKPRPPDGPVTKANESTDPRQELVEWLTDPGNPFFAKAAVNRVWAVFFGRGFVEPVDDFRISNPASNEALLNALAEDFAAHGYDQKHLIRTIMQSRLYQLSSMPNEYNLADTKNFSRSYRRRLPAEVLLDAVDDITGVREEYNGCPPGTRAIQTWSYKVRSHFMDAFGRPNSSSDCPCERDARTSVVQSLHMMNSAALQRKLADPEGRVRKLAETALPPEEIVAELYLVALCRYPSDEERKVAMGAFRKEGATRQTASEDVLWALLNSPEFVFNH